MRYDARRYTTAGCYSRHGTRLEHRGAGERSQQAVGGTQGTSRPPRAQFGVAPCRLDFIRCSGHAAWLSPSPCTRTAAPKSTPPPPPCSAGLLHLNSDRSVVHLPRRAPALAAASWACHVSVVVTHLLPPIALEHIPSEHDASRA
jgi:hypothetical protein